MAASRRHHAGRQQQPHHQQRQQPEHPEFRATSGHTPAMLMLFCGMRIYPLALLALLAASVAVKVAADEATMRAAVVSAGTIRVREVARPVAAPGQVLVRMRYASVNPADWKSAGGKPEDPAARAAAPRAAAGEVPGVDGSGVIAGVGPGVAGFK